VKVDVQGAYPDNSAHDATPARYVIGTDGIIAYAEVNPDYTQRPDPSELLPVLDRLKTSKAA
jgi:peroxiredoxin